jgi:hypothetical protein
MSSRSEPCGVLDTRGVTCSNGGESVDIVPVRAEARFSTMMFSRRMLDFSSGQMSAVLAYSHPEIVATVRDGIGRAAQPSGSAVNQFGQRYACYPTSSARGPGVRVIAGAEHCNIDEVSRRSSPSRFWP